MTIYEKKVLIEAVRWYDRIEKAKTSTEENEFEHITAIQEQEDILLKTIDKFIKSELK